MCDFLQQVKLPESCMCPRLFAHLTSTQCQYAVYVTSYQKIDGRCTRKKCPYYNKIDIVERIVRYVLITSDNFAICFCYFVTL